MSQFNPAELTLLLPELLLAGTVILLLLADLVVREPRHKRLYLTALALVGLGAAAAWVFPALLVSDPTITSAFFGQIAIDPVSTLFKALFLLVTGVAVFTSLLSDELPDKQMGEYYALLLSITVGMFLMAGANDLLMLYLGVELVSIVSYAMAGYRLHDRRSSEAALKYVIYGGAASGVMLFGISLLYGLFGTTELTALHRALADWGTTLSSSGMDPRLFPLTVLVSVIFVFVGIGYKIAVVPFHMWSPDVYEGAPTPFTGFLSVGPKAAGFVLLMRFFIGLFVPDGAAGYAADQGVMQLAIELPLEGMIGIIAAVTMTLGNLAAIPQQNVKRMLAYSSIAHAGYLLMGFVVLSEAALEAVALYLVIYFLMNLGAFTVCQAVRDRTGGEQLHDFRGLGVRAPLLAVSMVIFLLSLTGLPPLAGFIAKFYVFAALVERGDFWLWVLAVIAVVNSAVSLYYYMKVARAMFLTAPTTDAPLGAGLGYALVTVALVVPVLVLGLYWTPVTRSIDGAMVFYRSPPAAPAVSIAPALPPR